MIVVDASVLANVVGDDGADGHRARLELRAAGDLAAPDLVDTSLDQVLHATSTSKSQLSHYFPDGRAGLLLAVTDYEAEQVLEAQRPYIDDLSTVESWKAWRDAVVDHYARLGQRCPMGALTSELGNSSPEARRVVSELYDRWEGALMAGIQALLAAGLVPADFPARDRRLSYLETALGAALRPVFEAPVPA